MNQKWCILIIIFIILGVAGYVYITTPSLGLDNFHAKKYVETTKYSYSGDIEKSYCVVYGYNLTQIKAADSLHEHIKLYDKNGNLLDERKLGIPNTEINNYDYIFAVNKSVFKKVDYIEIIILEDDDIELDNGISKIIKVDDEVLEIDDTPPKHTEKKGRSYPTEDMYTYEKEPDWYWWHDDFGHPIQAPKHPYTPKLGE